MAPILVKKGVPATFFINSGFVDNKALFYRHCESLEIEFGHDFSQQQILDFLNNEKPYLTTEQIQMLSNQGFTIGAHSIDHLYYCEIPVGEQLHQTRESLEFVSSIVNHKWRLFAFPFTDFNVSKTFFKQIEPWVDLSFGTAGLKDDKIPFHLQRIACEKDRLISVETILKRSYLKYIAKYFF